jgi:hypothetical protein
MGMFSVGFVHHPMKANTAGDEANTAALVGKIQQFVEAHDDKVRREGSRVSRCATASSARALSRIAASCWLSRRCDVPPSAAHRPYTSTAPVGTAVQVPWRRAYSARWCPSSPQTNPWP